MSESTSIPRRTALKLAGAGLGVAAAGAVPFANTATASASTAPAPATSGQALPVKEIEEILQADGSVTNGVLGVGIDRSDIGPVTLRGVRIEPSFEVNGDLTFQPMTGGSAFFNGDLPLKNDEINPVIDAILANGLVFQAEHQHFYDFDPPVWFIHFRGRGEPLHLARSVHRVLTATSTPLPQHSPPHPHTPFDKERLKSILHGYDAQVSSGGVVTVFVARRNPIYIDGARVRPETNIATNVSFEPLDAHGSRAAAAPDFAMEAAEINRLMAVMRAQRWDIGCLYNQETDEHPQLFFSHQFKTGDPYELARQVRRGLDQTNTR
ncbi:MAG: DUF1259 domain-containing protein [Jatrophihabitantaceae bacterium]